MEKMIVTEYSRPIMLNYVSADSDYVYRIMINELKQQLKSGELDVSFS